MSEPVIITKSHNEFLKDTYNAFAVETGNPMLAASMTHAHLLHAQCRASIDQVKELVRIADALETLANLTDPVELGRLLALIRAGDVKRAETAAARGAQEEKDQFERVFGLADQEVSS